MKICDRCHAPAVTEIVFNEVELGIMRKPHYDLCESCKEKIKEFVDEPRLKAVESDEKKRPNRPIRKNKARR